MKFSLCFFCVLIIFNFIYFFLLCQEALDTVRLCKEDHDNAFDMLAAVLWLGNISYQVIDNENHVEVVADEGKVYILVSSYFLFINKIKFNSGGFPFLNVVST